MRKLMLGVALVSVMGAAPALAADKKAKADSKESSATISKENQNRVQNEDGTFQGKPVVEGPAKWSNMESGAASSGASSGEAGSSRSNMKSP